MDIRSCGPPLVAILRGLRPEEAAGVGHVLFDAGFGLLEVPFNRPQAAECVRILAGIRPANAMVGGGTILTTEEAEAIFHAGGQMMVAPNTNQAVIARSRELGLLCIPGVATPTEAFDALAAGADVLKWFPAEALGTSGLKSVLTVLPPGTEVWPVGGIKADNMADWRRAGATGFGVGGQLYEPGIPLETLAARARAFVYAWSQA